VEFADLQCPYCKVAQATMDQIVKDFPAARVVFQQFPLVDIHPSAFKAAAYGVCAQEQSDEALLPSTPRASSTPRKRWRRLRKTPCCGPRPSAPGLDGTAIVACANTQATKDIVNADIKLAVEAGIDQTAHAGGQRSAAGCPSTFPTLISRLSPSSKRRG